MAPTIQYIFYDMFYLDLGSEICNFADDTTIYACEGSIDTVIVKLSRMIQQFMHVKDDLQKFLDCFKENRMCANPAEF